MRVRVLSFLPHTPSLIIAAQSHSLSTLLLRSHRPTARSRSPTMPSYYEYPSGDKDFMESRVEVFSWSFGDASSFDDGSQFFHMLKRKAKAEADADDSHDVIPGVFKDKILIQDWVRFHEIYNPDKENALYTNLPFIPNQEEEETSSNKRKLDDSTISDPEIFALTGPDQGMPVVEVFDIVVRKNDPTNAGHVVDYFNWDRMPGDNKVTWMACDHSCYDTPSRYFVELLNSSFLLALDYVVIINSKVVTVDVKWLVPPSSEEENPDIYICGDLCLYSDEHEDYYSLLLQTPPNKAKMVRHDSPILLSRSVVAVPVHSGFTVYADLRNPLNNSFVEGYASFGNVPFSARNECQEFTKDIEGTDARMEVNVTVKLL